MAWSAISAAAVELVRVDAAASAPISAGVSLPLGRCASPTTAGGRRTIDAIAGAPVLREAGTKPSSGRRRLRAIAACMDRPPPLHIIHEYRSPAAAEGFLG
jgi:hypothetical protein